MDKWTLVLIIVGFISILILLYWQLIATEGTFLGAKIVALMYNLVARRYDGIKCFDPAVEEFFLSQPILENLNNIKYPRVLDVATGTGRVPRLLMAKDFSGCVIGLDYARKMLSVAANEMASIRLDSPAAYRGQAVFIWQNAMNLPFPENSFDMVTCLEALEFMPDPNKVLEEMVRVLTPGNSLLITRRRGWERYVMPGKAWSEQVFMEKLDKLGVTEIKAFPWQQDYDLVWAYKAGEQIENSQPKSCNLFLCPTCGSNHFTQLKNAYDCTSCGCHIPVGNDGVIELANSDN